MQFHLSGTRIADRYEVAGRPLVGGMGIVYLCFDHQEQRPVALKTFKPEYLRNRAARARFLEEGNTWVRLGKHAHIVHCDLVFQDSPRPDVYLVLELVAREEGRRDASLYAWLTPGQPLAADQALLIALQIARGMAHATDTIPGFVHRDLKPHNVLVGADHLSNAPINRVRVTDFGLVKVLRAEQVSQEPADADWISRPGRLTRASNLFGTPPYMAPEQWNSADVDVPADIYALGCILGEMLTGRLLVSGQTLAGFRQAHQGGQALASIQAIHPALREVLVRCLAVEPGERYGDWVALEADLVGAYGRVTGQPAPMAEVAGMLSRAERVAAGWSIAAMGASYLDMGNAQAALTYFERACQAGQAEGEQRLEAEALTQLGVAYGYLADVPRAIGCYEQALAISQRIGDRRGEGHIRGNLGTAYRSLGDAQRAIGYSEQALAIQQQLGDRRGEAVDLANLGKAYQDQGDPQRAIVYFEQTLTISREIGDRSGESKALGSLGNAYRELGEEERAIGYYEPALVIFREIGDYRHEGAALGNLGNAYRNLGDAKRAIGYYEQALAIDREIGDRRGVGNALGSLGNAYRDLGDPHRAIGYHEQALAIRREIGDRRGEGIDLCNLGNAYRDLEDRPRAFDYYNQAIMVHREIGDINGEALDLFNMAVLQKQQGDPEAALPLAREAARLWRRVGHAANAQRAQRLAGQLADGNRPDAGPGLVELQNQVVPPVNDAAANDVSNQAARVATGWSYLDTGKSYLKLDLPAEAQECFELARQVGQAEGERQLEAAGLRLLAQAHRKLGNTQQAIESNEEALAIYRGIGDRPNEGETLDSLGIAYARLGDTPRGIECSEQALAIAREISDRRRESNALGNLGTATLQLGDARRAIEYSEQALAIAREIGDQQGAATDLGNLGNAHNDLGDTEQAIECYEQALAINRELGDVFAAAMCGANLAMTLAQINQVGESVALLEQAIEDFLEAGYPQQAMQAQRMLAQLQRRYG